MQVALAETARLPLPQRLALAYAPARTRLPALALLGLDHRLGRAVAQAKEPIMGQVRLAWWRELLGQPNLSRPSADGLVAALAHWEGEADALIELVDAWEEMLAEPPLPASAALALVEARAGAFAALARIVGVGHHADDAGNAARIWALADLAAGLGNRQERDMTVSLYNGAWTRGQRLPRALRPLAILSGLARRSLAKGGSPLLDGPNASLVAMRIGIAGR